MRKKRPSRHLPGIISAAAKTDTLEAAKIARRGRKFSEIEEAVEFYFRTLKRWQAIKSGDKGGANLLRSIGIPESLVKQLPRATDEAMKGATQRLGQIFIDAVSARNSNQIREIATAVDALKVVRDGKSGSADSSSVDPKREALLWAKRIYEKRGEKIPIRHIAKLVLDENQLKEGRTDGYSALRRLCKEINFPIAESRRQRPRIRRRLS